jgi:hypothetical protein
MLSSGRLPSLAGRREVLGEMNLAVELKAGQSISTIHYTYGP